MGIWMLDKPPCRMLKVEIKQTIHRRQISYSLQICNFALIIFFYLSGRETKSGRSVYQKRRYKKVHPNGKYATYSMNYVPYDK